MVGEEAALKATRSFDAVYDNPDPRPYFRALAPLGYRQPDVVAAFFAEWGAAIARALGKERLRLFDFGCGYGALGAVLRHCLAMEDLYAHFAEGASRVEEDAGFFAARRKAEPGPSIVGLDIAGRAVAYAEACGFLDQGFAEDLTREAPSAALMEAFAECDVMVETGAVYSFLPDCYARLLESGARRPWMLFGPRGDADRRGLEALLRDHGYLLDEVSRQRRRYRRFADAAEEADSRGNMRALHRDPEVECGAGWFLNPLLLARPAGETGTLTAEGLAF